MSRILVWCCFIIIFMVLRNMMVIVNVLFMVIVLVLRFLRMGVVVVIGKSFGWIVGRIFILVFVWIWKVFIMWKMCFIIVFVMMCSRVILSW